MVQKYKKESLDCLQLKDNLQAKNRNDELVNFSIKILMYLFYRYTFRIIATVLVISILMSLFVISSVQANDSLFVEYIMTNSNHGNNFSDDKSNPKYDESTKVHSSFTALPQNSVLRRRRTIVREQAFGVGGNLLGPTLGYASAYLQYSYGRVIQMEAGLDLSTVYTGLNLYPHVFNRIEELSPYMGLMIGYSDPLKQNIAKGIYAYMPVGMRYVTSDDWYICFEIAATTASTVQTAPLFLGIKLGYLFKRR